LAIVEAELPQKSGALRGWLGELYVRRTGVTEDGVFEAFAPGPLLSLFGAYPVAAVHEEFIREWIEPGAVVWDIGAGFGGFAFPAALRAKVFAAEADPLSFRQLRRSLALPRNKMLNLFAARLLVSDFEREKRPNAARVTTLDALAKKIVAPGILRINRPGLELKVLEGGRALLSSTRPLLFLEDCQSPIGPFLKQLGYVILDGAGDRGHPLEEPVACTLAVPFERYEKSAIGSVHKVLSEGRRPYEETFGRQAN
jgi:hypothetical protein